MSLLRQELSELYDEAGQQFFHCALAVTTSADLAEDAVHDAFFKAFRMTERPQNLRAYMFRVVRNAALDIARRQSKMVQPTSDHLFEVSSLQISAHELSSQRGQTEPGRDMQAVTEAIGALPDDQRETVLEHLVAELTFREIAELRDRPMGTVVTWYRRGIQNLRTKMSNHDE